MALFDTTIPANTEALKLGAQRIRELQTTLNTLLGTLFEDDGTPKTNTVTTDEIQALAVTAAKIAADAITTTKLINGVLSADATGRAKMADAFITLAKIADGIFTADATGRAKFVNEFVTTALLKDGAVTDSKIAAGAVTPAKLSSAVKVASAFCRWTGAGFEQPVMNPTLPVGAFTARTRVTLQSALVGFPLLGSGVTEDNAPTAVIVKSTTVSGANNGITLGQLYFIYAHSSTQVSLHTSFQGAIDGTTDIVTMSGNFSGSTYYFKYFAPSTVFKRGCDIIPVSSTGSAVSVHRFRVVWRVPWADAASGLVIPSQALVSANDNIQWLRVIATATDYTDLWYCDEDSTPSIRGDQTGSDLQGYSSYNCILAHT